MSNIFEITALNTIDVVSISEYANIPLLTGNINLKCYITPEVCEPITQPALPASLRQQIFELQLNPTQNFEIVPIHIDILVGLDQISKIIIDGFFKVLKHGVLSIPSQFGDILLGTTDNQTPYNEYKITRCLSSLSNNKKLEYLLKRIFVSERWEDIDENDSFTQEELESMELFNQNLKIFKYDDYTGTINYELNYRDEGKHELEKDLKLIFEKNMHLGTKFILQVGLNRRKNGVLPQTHYETIRRAQLLFKKLNKTGNETQKQQYMDKIRDMLKRGTISPIGTLEKILPDIVERGTAFLLATNVLYNRASQSTPTRFTIDGSKMSRFVGKGPKIIANLFKLCVKFRSKPYVVTTDLMKMYDAISLRDQDRPFLRFLHRDLENPNSEIEVLQYNSISMGLPDSVFLAIMTLHKLAELAKDHNETVHNIIKEYFYLDDLVISFDTVKEAIDIIPKLNNFLKLFNLKSHKWGTNDRTIMEAIPQENRDSRTEFVIKNVDEISLEALFEEQERESSTRPENETTRTRSISDSNHLPYSTAGKSLGIHWEVSDQGSFLTFKHLAKISEKLTNPKILTKRSISSACGLFFQPTGELSHIAICIKICLSLSWKFDNLANLSSWDTNYLDPDLPQKCARKNLPQDLPQEEKAQKLEQIRQKITHFYTIFTKNLQICSTWKIPRYIFGENSLHARIRKKSLIMCTDAGIHAKSIVIYARALLDDGSIVIGLVTAKSRLNQKRIRKTEDATNVPNYELDSLNDGCDLLEKIKEILKIYEYYIAIDANVVLQQIQKAKLNGCGIFKKFTANRIRNILSKVDPDFILYINTASNPADLGSKPLLAEKQQDLWFYGSPIFRKKWDLREVMLPPTPPAPINEDTLQISKKSKTCLISIKKLSSNNIFDDLIGKYSTLNKLLKITFYVMTFLSKISLNIRMRRECLSILFIDPPQETNGGRETRSTRKRKKSEEMTFTEYDTNARNQALYFWIRVSQNDQFYDEMKTLEEEKPISQKSKLKNINPFLQKETGLLRVNGRLEFLDAPYDTRKPIILAKHAKITKLIILHAHHKLACASEHHLMNELRKSFWVIGMKTHIRKTIKKCQKCRIRNPLEIEMPVAPLPQERINKSQPFDHVGMDIGGPYFTKEENNANQMEQNNALTIKEARNDEKRKLVKRYLLIFTDLFARITHIEMILSKSTEEILAAIRRLEARRGKIQTIFCDNEAAFHDANRHIQALYGKVNFDKVKNSLADQGIDFKFGTPYAPFKLGIIESIVKVTKNVLKRKLTRAKLTTHAFMTLTIEAEGILNSRPIAMVTANNEERIITPNELATGKASNIFPSYRTDKNYAIETINTKKDIIKQLKYRDKLRKQILMQFYNDYVLALQAYQQKSSRSRPLKEKDICIINDSKLVENGKVAIGSIIKLTRSKLDGQPRSATIRIPPSKIHKERILTRDVRTLARLECDSIEECD